MIATLITAPAASQSVMSGRKALKPSIVTWVKDLHPTILLIAKTMTRVIRRIIVVGLLGRSRRIIAAIISFTYIKVLLVRYQVGSKSITLTIDSHIVATNQVGQ